MQFSPDSPFCDGICFDDLHLVKDDLELRRILLARDLVWLTVFTDTEGNEYAGSVIAGSIEAALVIADSRGLGETIEGLYKDP